MNRRWQTSLAVGGILTVALSIPITTAQAKGAEPWRVRLPAPKSIAGKAVCSATNPMAMKGPIAKTAVRSRRFDDYEACAIAMGGMNFALYEVLVWQDKYVQAQTAWNDCLDNAYSTGAADPTGSCQGLKDQADFDAMTRNEWAGALFALSISFTFYCGDFFNWGWT